VLIFEILFAGAFVLSSGIFFNARFRNNLILVGIAGFIATISSVLLLLQIQELIADWRRPVATINTRSVDVPSALSAAPRPVQSGGSDTSNDTPAKSDALSAAPVIARRQNAAVVAGKIAPPITNSSPVPSSASERQQPTPLGPCRQYQTEVTNADGATSFLPGVACRDSAGNWIVQKE
jgi:hypothetical protein